MTLHNMPDDCTGEKYDRANPEVTENEMKIEIIEEAETSLLEKIKDLILEVNIKKKTNVSEKNMEVAIAHIKEVLGDLYFEIKLEAENE